MAKIPRIFIRSKVESRVVAASLGRARGRLTKEMEKELSEIAAIGKRTFQFFAPVKTGRLRGNIRSRKVGKGKIDITVEARDPESGYDYVGVTRFGHRAREIARDDGGPFRLNFVGGFWTYSAYIKGYDPDFDWAEEALETVQAIANQRTHRLSSKIDLRLVTK